MKTQDIKDMGLAYKQVLDEALKGDQHKLDKDKDGDIDAKDFARMRKKKTNEDDEVEINPKMKAKKKADPEMACEEDLSKVSKWPVYARIMEVRAAHNKGATEPEAMDSKASKGEKDFKAMHKVDMVPADLEKKGHDDASAAGRVTKPAAARNGDNKAGDKNVMNTPEDITKKAGMKA